MVCYCLDLRGNNKVSRFLSNAIVSVLTGAIQLIIWVVALFNIVVQPGSMKEVAQQLSTAAYAVTVVMLIVCIGFSILLLVGLFKKRDGHLKIYLIYNCVLTVLLIILLFVNLFTQPTRLGFGGFFSIIFIILLNLLYYFVIRNYYISVTTQKQQDTGTA